MRRVGDGPDRHSAFGGSALESAKAVSRGQRLRLNRALDWLQKYGITRHFPRTGSGHLHHDNGSHFDKQTCRRRCIVERTIRSLNQCRRIGTRYEKLATIFLEMLKFAMFPRCLAIAFSDSIHCRLLTNASVRSLWLRLRNRAELVLGNARTQLAF